MRVAKTTKCRGSGCPSKIRRPGSAEVGCRGGRASAILDPASRVALAARADERPPS